MLHLRYANISESFQLVVDPMSNLINRYISLSYQNAYFLGKTEKALCFYGSRENIQGFQQCYPQNTWILIFGI